VIRRRQAQVDGALEHAGRGDRIEAGGDIDQGAFGAGEGDAVAHPDVDRLQDPAPVDDHAGEARPADPWDGDLSSLARCAPQPP
jgi:hypothetical protein